MSWIFEDVTWLIAAGIVVEAVLAVILLRTGRGAVLFAMGAVFALVLVGVAAERLIVTEPEEVESALDAVATALEANDVPTVLSYLAPEASQIRDTVERELPRLTITEAKIRDLDVKINRLTSPATAEARFRGILNVKDNSGQFPYENYMQRFTVHLRREGNRWLLVAYEAQRIEPNQMPWEKAR